MGELFAAQVQHAIAATSSAASARSKASYVGNRRSANS